MRTSFIRIALICLAAAATVAGATDIIAPRGASPGAEDRVLVLETRCPTFTWEPVAGALFSQLVVYRLPADVGEPLATDLDAEDEVLYVEVPGGAGAWAPSAEQCLERGGRYVWFVRAVHETAGDEVVAASEWSPGRYFEVPGTPTPEDVRHALELLRQSAAAVGTDAHGPASSTDAPLTKSTTPPAGGSGEKSVPTASAAIRGAHPARTGEAYGVVGTSDSPAGAGLAAANLRGGADLVLDGSADGVADTRLSESGLDRSSAALQTFSFVNTRGGGLTLDVQGAVAATALNCPGCVEAEDLAAGAVTADKIDRAAVTASAIANSAVTSSKIAPAAVTKANLAAAGGTSGQVLATDGAALGWSDAGAGDITAVHPGPGLSGGGDSGSVTLEITPQGVTSTMLASSAVTTAKIAAIAVDASKIANQSVLAKHLFDGAVTEAKIADGAVTGPKIATGAVNSTQLATGAVTLTKIQDGAVAGSKIATGAVTATKVNSSDIQLRVAGTCSSGSAIRSIGSDGNVTCETAGGGDLTPPVVLSGQVDSGTVLSANNTGGYGVGIDGTASGSHGLGVRGIATGGSSIGVYGEADNESGTGVKGVGFTYGGRFETNGFGGAIGIVARGGPTGRAARFEGNVLIVDRDTGDALIEFGGATGIVARGGPTGRAAKFEGNVLIVDRDTGDHLIELGRGLDYAEGFDVSDDEPLEPGTVLVIDPESPGKLTRSRRPYETGVAGIIAGADGLGSGVRLGAGGFDHDVALAGRVYCQVDATEHAVEPGDLLTTSDLPGHAMKAADPERARGAVLGKAMAPLAAGTTGRILVLVSLQ